MVEEGLDFVHVFTGYWKRCLTWRLFGGDFRILKSSNSIVCVEPVVHSAPPAAEDNGYLRTEYLQWKFGDSLDLQKLQFGYLMQVETRVRSGGEGGTETEVVMEWQYRGQRCTGSYQASTRMAVLDFRLDSCARAVITYRVIDQNTLAVHILEVDSNGGGKPVHAPTMQYGHMFRINPDDYGLAIQQERLTAHLPSILLDDYTANEEKS